MKYKIKMSSTIPVAQYGNIIPTIEIEGDNYKEIEKETLAKIENLWKLYGEKKLNKNIQNTDGFKQLETFTGETLLYNDGIHKYLTLGYEPLISGSVYAKQFAKPFNKAMILPAFAKKHDLKPELIDTMWSDNGELSRTFGDAIHKLMENWFRYGKLTCYKTPKNPLLAKILADFPDKDKVGIPEALVSNLKKGYVGQIDNIIVTSKEKKQCYLIDYKTDGKIEPNLEKHFNQISFYAHILMDFGWNVTKIVVWNYTDSWKCYESKVLDLIN